MRKTIRRVLAGAMALGLAATMMPGLSMTAKAHDVAVTVPSAGNIDANVDSVEVSPALTNGKADGDNTLTVTVKPKVGYTYEYYDLTDNAPFATIASSTDGNTQADASFEAGINGDNLVLTVDFKTANADGGAGTAELSEIKAPQKKRYTVKYEAASGGEALTVGQDGNLTAPTALEFPATGDNNYAEYQTAYPVTVTPAAGYRLEKPITYSIPAAGITDKELSGDAISQTDVTGDITIKVKLTKLIHVADETDPNPADKYTLDDETNKTENKAGKDDVEGTFTDLDADQYSIAKGGDFKLVVEDSTNFMFTKNSKVKTDKGEFEIKDLTYTATAKGTATLTALADDTTVQDITNMAPIIKVKGQITDETTDAAKNVIGIVNTKTARNYNDEIDTRNGQNNIITGTDGHNPGTEAYKFKITNTSRGQNALDDADIDIQKIEVEYTDADDATQTYEIKNPKGVGEYEIPDTVMGEMKEGSTATIKVTGAVMKKVVFRGSVYGDKLTFTSTDDKYKVDANNILRVPENKTVTVLAETPIGKKYAQDPSEKTVYPDPNEGVSFGSLNETMTSLPIEIDGEKLEVSASNEATIYISDDEPLVDYPQDGRIQKEAGRDGMSANVGDANNGKNQDGTGSSDGTPGQNVTGFADDGQIADYAKPFVKALADAGIVKGKANNRFDPKGGATRAEFATMVQRAMGLKADKSASKFPDVKSPLHEDLIAGVIACEDLNPFIVEGYPDGNFQPDKQISRAEGILMIYRAAGSPSGTGSSSFRDTDAWYAAAANWAASQEIALGDGNGNFNGSQLLTREDLATLLGRAINKGAIKAVAEGASDASSSASTSSSSSDASSSASTASSASDASSSASTDSSASDASSSASSSASTGA